jgi:hypothetical protein
MAIIIIIQIELCNFYQRPRSSSISPFHIEHNVDNGRAKSNTRSVSQPRLPDVITDGITSETTKGITSEMAV